MLPPLAGVVLVTELYFDPARDWRFDFAFPAHRVAIEIDGRGRHQTVDGVRKDLEKLRAAVLRGWHVLRFPATDRQEALSWARQTRELLGKVEPVGDECSVCGCTDDDCSDCVERTGEPCYWAQAGLCSACAERSRVEDAARARSKNRKA